MVRVLDHRMFHHKMNRKHNNNKNRVDFKQMNQRVEHQKIQKLSIIRVVLLIRLAAKMSRFSNLMNSKKIDGDVENEPNFSDHE